MSIRFISVAILVSMVTGCSSMALPYGPQARSDERQKVSDSCWEAGHTDESVIGAFKVMFSAPIKAVVCPVNDLVNGQAQFSDTSNGRSGPVHVKGYYKSNGTYVSSHTRSSPDSITSNNLGSK